VTDEEIKKLAEEIVAKKGGFWVEPEEHYQSHKRLDRLLDIFDTVQSGLIKGFIAAFVLGILAISAIGVGWHK